MEISRSSLQEVESALARYEEVVNSADIRIATKNTYLLNARSFVKWLKGEFRPGSRKAQQQQR